MEYKLHAKQCKIKWTNKLTIDVQFDKYSSYPIWNYTECSVND